MKTWKRALALAGAVLLLGLYGAMLFFALTDRSSSKNLLMASIVMAAVIPALIYAMMFIYRLLKKHYSQKKEPGAPGQDPGKKRFL